jgi:hypothetical protein
LNHEARRSSGIDGEPSLSPELRKDSPKPSGNLLRNRHPEVRQLRCASFRDDLSNDNSKDGLGADLFPLTAKEQKEYRYELAGEDTVQGRAVYRIRFTPADRNDISWAGEALIDKDEFQPVTVFTRLSRRIPLWVRTMLGTNLPGIGFNVQYRRFNDGVWFPVSFGTEFRLHVLFFINREISVSLENSGFHRARSESKILGYEPAPWPTL